MIFVLCGRLRVKYLPTNTSLTSLGNSISALSEEDKRPIPFVERAAWNTKLGTISIKGEKSNTDVVLIS